jgi:hypothetical protein
MTPISLIKIDAARDQNENSQPIVRSVVAFRDKEELATFLFQHYLDSLSEDGFIIYEGSYEVVELDDPIETAGRWLLR